MFTKQDKLLRSEKLIPELVGRKYQSYFSCNQYWFMRFVDYIMTNIKYFALGNYGLRASAETFRAHQNYCKLRLAIYHFANLKSLP